MKVAVLFDRFGPYHIARLEAAAKYLNIFAIEVSARTSEYQWDKVESKDLINRVTLFADKETPGILPGELKKAIHNQLSSLKPDAVAVNGWADRAALSALYWCLENKVPSIVMSESAADDEKRNYWKELIKTKIVQQFSSGLVGGKRHVEYLVHLGMDRKKIFIGYDVVDNNYFLRKAIRAREQRDFWRKEKNLPENYFLIVSRFIQKKNLAFVIETYKKYYENAGERAWQLFILGDGPLKKHLLKLTNDLGLNELIHFEGFKQYDELPIYFGLANVLLHASTTEQWGLVVNEAMASGLPVIISERCGCVPELVYNGKNGFSFDPVNQLQLVSILLSFSDGSHCMDEMGKESLKIVAEFNADAFGRGLQAAAETARNEVRSKKPSLTAKLILRSLITR
jgi:1,2-diacylglycerol 3-alpha-glucosyltransferase